MICYIKNKIYLTPDILTPQENIEIKKDLTLLNPVFNNLLQMGKSTWKIPKYLKYYEETTEGILILPIGYMPKLLKLKPKLDYIDKRENGIDITEIQFKGELRPYQQEALQQMLKRTIGVVNMTTGSGKTNVLISYIVEKSKNTLVLVDTLELAQQFRERLLQFTNLKYEEIGMIGGGEYKLGKVTIALVQSIHKMEKSFLEGLNEIFGIVLLDECHIAGAQTIYDVMSKLNAKYKFGVSATPYRADGLTQTIFWALGPICFSIDESQLSEYILSTIYKKVETDFHYPLVSSAEYPIMISELSLDSDRNDLIAKTWKKEGEGKQSLILCSRIVQVLEIQKRIPNSEVLIGPLSKELKNILKLTYNLDKMQLKEFSKLTTKKHRNLVINKLNDGTCQTIISTFGLFSKGIDIKTLTVLFIAGASRSTIWIKQARGRIMRKIEGKSQPTIIDFVDHRVELLKYQARERQRILTEKN